MTSGQKVTLSLLLSILVFSAFTVIAFSGLFNLLEVNFYQPFVMQEKEQKAQEIVAAQKEYVTTLMERFNAFSLNADVKTYVELRPSDKSVQNRELLRSELITNNSALLGVRIIDENGENVYFSTFNPDLIKSKKGSLSYKNYSGLDELSFASISSSEWISENLSAEEKCRIVKDSSKNRIIFSFPFYDSKNYFKGTIAFYCDAGNLSRYLYNKNLIDINGFGILVSEGVDESGNTEGFGGYVFGLPNYGRTNAEQQILRKWKEAPDENFWKIIPENENDAENNISQENSEDFEPFCVFTKKTDRKDLGFVALIFSESEIKLSSNLRILLLSVAFLTFYLIVFLIISCRHDPIVVIKDRIRKYKNQFLDEYKKIEDLEEISDLKNHKKALERQIKNSLGKIAKKHQEDVEELFEKAWNEILVSIGKKAAPMLSDNIVVNKDDLKTILEDILGSGKLTVRTVQNVQKIDAPSAPQEAKKPEPVEPESSIKAEETSIQHEAAAEPEEVIEAEEIAEAEEVESVEDAEEIAEAEEIEAIEEAKEITEAEEVEAIEEAEEVAEAEEIEPVEEVEEVGEAEEIEAAEEVEEIAEAEEIEAIEEAEEIAEAEEAEEVETVEEAEDVAEAEEVEAIEEAEEIAEAEEVESVEDAEEITEAEEIEAVEDAEEITEVDEVEAIEEAEEIADAEEVESVGEAEEIADAEEVEAIEEAGEITEAEEIEPIEEAEEIAEADLYGIDADDFAPGINENNIDDSDEIYEDDFLLEKIDFGVPESEATIDLDDTSDSENFEVTSPDFKFLDLDDVDGFMDPEEYARVPKAKNLAELELPKYEDEPSENNFIDDEASEPEQTSDTAPSDPSDFEVVTPGPAMFADAGLDSIVNDEAIHSTAEEMFADEETRADAADSENLEVEYAEKSETDLPENHENSANENSFIADDITTAKNDSADSEPEELEEVSELETLEKMEETMPFSFTKLASDNYNVTELLSEVPDSIIQNPDGTFSIAKNDGLTPSMDLDPEFKKLVDSILH